MKNIFVILLLLLGIKSAHSIEKKEQQTDNPQKNLVFICKPPYDSICFSYVGIEGNISLKGSVHYTLDTTFSQSHTIPLSQKKGAKPNYIHLDGKKIPVSQFQYLRVGSDKENNRKILLKYR